MNEASQLKPDATLKDRLFDMFGGYTIVLNGTVCEKRADLPDELRAETINNVVYRILKLVTQAELAIKKEGDR